MIRQCRSILGPRDLNRDYRQELSPQLRTGIVAYKDAGLSAAEIARRTNLPFSTIKTTLERCWKWVKLRCGVLVRLSRMRLTTASTVQPCDGTAVRRINTLVILLCVR